MLVVLAAVATLALQAGWTCVDCGLEKGDARLCTLHAEAERAALPAAKKALSSKLEEERSAALESLSGLTRSHVNAPSERVARQIAQALRDESLPVRELAVRLLGPPQHALIAMESLLEELSRTEKELQHLLDDERDMNKKGSGSLREKQAEALETALEGNAKAQEALLAWRLTIVNQLAHFPDDRVVGALCRGALAVDEGRPKAREGGLLEKWSTHRDSCRRLSRALDLSGALVRLGTREALRTAARTLTVLVAEVADLEKDRSSSPREFPRLREMLEELLRQLTDARDRATHEIADVLAEKRWSEPPPERHGLPVLLAPWIERNLESIPEHLTGVLSPVW